MGATLWYAANLGCKCEGGDRERLKRELDTLRGLGVNMVRVLAASNGPDDSSYRSRPSFEPEPRKYNRDMLEGLDFVLLELSKRDMVATLILNNFRPWSGGMAQYVSWATSIALPYSAKKPNWPMFMDYATQFYTLPDAISLADEYTKQVVQRRNSYTGVMYSEDPAIFSWELANEPEGSSKPKAYRKWLGALALQVKEWDPNHLVSIATAGFHGGGDLAADMRMTSLDFATLHVWPERWGWYVYPETDDVNLDVAMEKAKKALDTHLKAVESLDSPRPLVFGALAMARDYDSLDPTSSVASRIEYLEDVLAEATNMIKAGRALAGVSFHGWAGEGRPIENESQQWHPGVPPVGDPPDDPQGKFSIYNDEARTCQLITKFAKSVGMRPALPKVGPKKA